MQGVAAAAGCCRLLPRLHHFLMDDFAFLCSSTPKWLHLRIGNTFLVQMLRALVLCAANSKSLGGSLLNLCRLLNENATSASLSAGIMDFERIQKQKEEKNVLKRGLQVSSTLLEPVVKSVSFGILN